jgi:CRP-like cAMP-binding protein
VPIPIIPELQTRKSRGNHDKIVSPACFQDIIFKTNPMRRKNLMDTKEALKSIQILDGLEEEQYEMLLPDTEIVEKKEGETLFSVGDEASCIFFMLEGKLSIQVKLSSRPETVGIVVLQNFGQMVGWSGLIGGSYYTAAGVCQADTKLLCIKGTELMKVLEHNPCTGFAVMREISQVISSRIRNLQSVVLKTI